MESYRKRCGGFPETLLQLTGPPSGADADCQRLGNLGAAAGEALGLGPGLAEPERERLEVIATSGKDFAFQYAYNPRELLSTQVLRGQRLYLRYEVRADPIERGTTGFYSFWMTEAGTYHYRYSDKHPAGPDDPAWYFPPDSPRALGPPQ